MIMLLNLSECSLKFQMQLTRETKSPDILDALSDSTYTMVLSEVIKNEFTSQQTRDFLKDYLYSEDYMVSSEEKDIPIVISSELYSDDLMYILAEETANEMILEFLASHSSNLLVRYCSISNPHFPKDKFKKYFKDLMTLFSLMGIPESELVHMKEVLPYNKLT